MPNAGIAGPEPARSAPGAIGRILEAAAARMLEAEPGGLSVQDVADRAGVSKALIHYHFDSRERLLARLADWLGEAVANRQTGVLVGVEPASAIDAWWVALDRELALGHLRLLAELAHDPGDEVRAAAARAVREWRRIVVARTEDVFRLLALAPRVPTELVADVIVAFELGLVVAAAPAAAGEVSRTAGADPRARFDVFWLALLALTE